MSNEKAAMPLARRGHTEVPGPKGKGKSKKAAISTGNVYNEVKLNPRQPIPYENAGATWTTTGNNTYVPFLAPNDNFAADLLEARLLSPTQFACVNTKKLYLLGNGIKILNLDENKTAPEQWVEFTKRANGRRQSLNRVFESIWENRLTSGNSPIEVVRTEVGGKKFINMYSKNFQDCRLGPEDEITGESEYALVSKMFRHKGILTKHDTVKKIPLYKTNRANEADNWLKDGNGVERTMIWVKNEVAGFNTYGMPSSIAGLLWQLVEYSGGRFNLDNLDNNMVLGAAIFLTGNLTQDEADKISSTIVRRHTGHGRRGRTAVFSSENGISDVKVVQMEAHKEGSYNELDDKAQAKIILANEWDADLAGLPGTENSLGKGAGYLEEKYKQKLKSLIIPEQRRMIEDVMPSLVEIFKNWMGVDLYALEFGFDPIQLDTRTSEVATTVAGLNTFLDIVDMVAAGQYPLEAAIKLVMAWYGRSEKEATEQLGNIQITKSSVRTKSNGQGGANNPAGNP